MRLNPLEAWLAIQINAAGYIWGFFSKGIVRLQQNAKKRTSSQLAVQAVLGSLFQRTVAALQAFLTKLRRLDTFASLLVPRVRRFRNLNDSAGAFREPFA